MLTRCRGRTGVIEISLAVSGDCSDPREPSGSFGKAGASHFQRSSGTSDLRAVIYKPFVSLRRFLKASGESELNALQRRATIALTLYLGIAVADPVTTCCAQSFANIRPPSAENGYRNRTT
jgi:hypothetical protein